jgi:hypothetical protein
MKSLNSLLEIQRKVERTEESKPKKLKMYSVEIPTRCSFVI